MASKKTSAPKAPAAAAKKTAKPKKAAAPARGANNDIIDMEAYDDDEANQLAELSLSSDGAMLEGL